MHRSEEWAGTLAMLPSWVTSRRALPFSGLLSLHLYKEDAATPQLDSGFMVDSELPVGRDLGVSVQSPN